MAKISQLLTGNINGKQVINVATVRKQQLAVATALQILEDFPYRTTSKNWERYNFLRGVLLADDVGGGKTFEALSIICQSFLRLAHSKRARFRVLIIAAPAIRSKWEWKKEDEIEKWCDLKRFVEQTKLSKRKKILLESFLATAQRENVITSKHNWKYIQNLRQGIWIASFGSLPATKGSKTMAEFKRDRHIQFPSGYFDYIIADEAHIVKSGYIDSDENLSTSLNNSAIRKIYAVQNENANAKLLLLTATPFQNNLNEFIHMISLVETPNYLNYSIVKIITAGLKKLYVEIELLKTENGITKDKILHLIESFDSEVGKLIEEDVIEIKRPKEISTNGRKSGLNDFLRDIIIRNNKEPLDIVSAGCNLNDAGKLQYLFFRDMVSNRQGEDREMFSIKLSQLVSSDPAFANSLRKIHQKEKYGSIKKLFQNKHLAFECKFNALLSEIENKKLPSDKKVIVVFCRFIPTIEELERRLKKVYQAANVLRMDGRTSNTRKRKELLDTVDKKNQETMSKVIFLVSQVGNEGLDFDNFSDTVIHFDGHYNPAVIDQRNGRVYRRGNLNREITIKHVYLKETYDQRIKFIELEKRKMKNFFLGDSGLEEIIKRILLRGDMDEEKILLKELEKIKFDFEPKGKYLLPGVKKRLK
jgi:superfamily II DNA or RNA helicase